jgi:hypothetical protein
MLLGGCVFVFGPFMPLHEWSGPARDTPVHDCVLAATRGSERTLPCIANRVGLVDAGRTVARDALVASGFQCGATPDPFCEAVLIMRGHALHGMAFSDKTYRLTWSCDNTGRGSLALTVATIGTSLRLDADNARVLDRRWADPPLEERYPVTGRCDAYPTTSAVNGQR